MFSKTALALLAISAQQALAHVVVLPDLETRAAGHAAHNEAPKFGYTTLNAANGWPAQCSTGKHQSPIDIKTSAINLFDNKDMIIEWPDLKNAKLANHNPGVYVEEFEGQPMRVRLPSVNDGNLTLPLVQYHFHTPHEHTIDGKKAPMEVHFVHTDSEKIVVLGAHVDVKEGNSPLDKALAHINAIPGAHMSEPTGPIKMSEMAEFFKKAPLRRYFGSLTTPPCTEGVQFFIAETKLSVNKQTLADLTTVLKNNARPVTAYTGNWNGKTDL